MNKKYQNIAKFKCKRNKIQYFNMMIESTKNAEVYNMRAILKNLSLVAISVVIFSVLLTSCAPTEEGTVWHYGKDEPSEALAAAVGDFYMKTDSGDVYVLEEGGWNKLANLNGEDGKDGAAGKEGSLSFPERKNTCPAGQRPGRPPV